MNDFINLLVMMLLVSCSIEQLEDGSFSCLLSPQSSFGEGAVSCIDLEAPKFGDFAAEDTCNDWDGAFVAGVRCATVPEQLGCRYPQTIAGFQVTAVAWYKITTEIEDAQILDYACADQQGTAIRAK